MIEQGERVYRAVHGARISDKDAAVIGPEIERLAGLRGVGHEYVTAEEVLQAARDPKSPLHRYFEWDRNEAARQWNLEQARYLARSWTVTIVYRDAPHPTVYPMPGMVNIKTPEDKERAYIPVDRVLRDPELRELAAKQALTALRHWQERYARFRSGPSFERFEPVFDAIEQVEAEEPPEE